MTNTTLPKNERLIMDIFWDSDAPLTGRELKAYFANWNYPYIVNMLTKLEEKGMIEECGTVSFGTGRARKFVAAVSRVEYAASLAASCGIRESDIAQVTVALVKENCSRDSELYGKLNKIIEDLKGGHENNLPEHNG